MSVLYVKDSNGNWKEIPSIGGYTKDEVNTMVAECVKKSGDTMAGTLNGNINSDGTTYRVWGAVAN